MHPIQFYLQKGIVTHHLEPNVLTINVLYESTVESCKGHLSLHWLHYCVWSVCAWKAPELKHSPNPSYPLFPTSHYPHGSACSVFVLRWQACVSQEGHPPSPNLYPHAQVPGSISFSLSAPSRIGSNISLWSLVSLCGLWGPSHSLALRFSLYCVLSFSLVAFYSFKFFPLFSSPSLSCSFLVFSFSPFSPNSPVGPLFSLSKMPFSSPLPLYPCSWEELETICFIYSFIYLVWAEVDPACISLYLKV